MGTTRDGGPDQPLRRGRALRGPHATRDEGDDEPAMPQRSERQRERRCYRCGDPWSEEGPAWCADPVDDYLTVTRTRRTGGRVLESVIGHDGDVIAAVWVRDEEVARAEGDGSAGIHRDGRPAFKSAVRLSGPPEIELEEDGLLDLTPPDLGRSSDMGRVL